MSMAVRKSEGARHLPGPFVCAQGAVLASPPPPLRHPRALLRARLRLCWVDGCGKEGFPPSCPGRHTYTRSHSLACASGSLSRVGAAASPVGPGRQRGLYDPAPWGSEPSWNPLVDLLCGTSFSRALRSCSRRGLLGAISGGRSIGGGMWACAVCIMWRCRCGLFPFLTVFGVGVWESATRSWPRIRTRRRLCRAGVWPAGRQMRACGTARIARRRGRHGMRRTRGCRDPAV